MTGDRSQSRLLRRRILTDTRIPALVVISSGWLLLIGTRLVYPVLIPQIRTEFGINNTLAGFLFMLIVFSFAIMQFPSGLIADRTGERPILLLGLLTGTAGVLLLATAPIFGVFLVGCVLFGVGSGLYTTPQLSVLSKIFPERAGTAHGITFAAGNVGTTILPVLGGFFAVFLTWRLGFGIVIPIFILVAVGIWVSVPGQFPAFAAPELSVNTSVKRIIKSLRQPNVLFAFLAFIIGSFVLQGLMSFLPTFLIEIKGITQSASSVLFGFFFGAGIIGQLVAGALADRYNRPTLLAGTAILTAIGILAIIVINRFILLIVFIAILSFINSFISVANTYLVSVLPDAIQASGLGLFRSIVISVGSTSPLFMGMMVDTGRFTLGFVLLIALLVIAAGLLQASRIAG